MALKTLKDILGIEEKKYRQRGTCEHDNSLPCHGCINSLKQETIEWIKDAKTWESGLHEDNSHFVIAMWMEFMNITDEDLK